MQECCLAEPIHRANCWCPESVSFLIGNRVMSWRIQDLKNIGVSMATYIPFKVQSAGISSGPADLQKMTDDRLCDTGAQGCVRLCVLIPPSLTLRAITLSAAFHTLPPPHRVQSSLVHQQHLLLTKFSPPLPHSHAPKHAQPQALHARARSLRPPQTRPC